MYAYNCCGLDHDTSSNLAGAANSIIFFILMMSITNMAVCRISQVGLLFHDHVLTTFELFADLFFPFAMPSETDAQHWLPVLQNNKGGLGLSSHLTTMKLYLHTSCGAVLCVPLLLGLFWVLEFVSKFV